MNKVVITDENNFNYRMQQFYVEMSNGILYVDGVMYEEDENDPSYTWARELAKAKGLYS